jgi:hypothetical protein
MLDIIIQVLVGVREFLLNLREMLWQNFWPNVSNVYEQFSKFDLHEKLDIVWGDVGIFISITCFLLALVMVASLLERSR